MFEKIYEFYKSDILFLYHYTPFSRENKLQSETDKHIMNIKNQEIYNSKSSDSWKGEKREESISFFKNALKENFTNLVKLLPPDFSQKVLISLVPSSTEKNYNNNMLNICEYLCEEFNFLNGLNILSRHYSVQKSHCCGGHREVLPHLKSITVNTPKFIKDKSIILFDEVVVFKLVKNYY